MKDWTCLCGRFVRDKRLCPSCKLMRFSIENSTVLDYWGLKLGAVSSGSPFNMPVNSFSEHVLISAIFE
ncbi:hypothetical protein [Candidatus Nitrosotenuis uzonensis]|uniref:Uncharacterized protein n=1 Tax=Candidatus Nitrosotenuis uzonensis TaxID=1407055 RepID=V6ARF4_9ARCH|nr:hypothetical protein [Candidatus Nitrosotenuis uzonensis]CDI05013.1 hypothetical protein NITUZ_140088 [Candidatus Nitrosotenuis uzonensis]